MGDTVKETKPLYLTMILIFVFTLVYNVLFAVTLEFIPDMTFKNHFFMFEYSYMRNGNIVDTHTSPNFLNWVMLLAFVAAFISLLVRNHINKTLRPYKTSESR